MFRKCVEVVDYGLQIIFFDVFDELGHDKAVHVLTSRVVSFAKRQIITQPVIDRPRRDT